VPPRELEDAVENICNDLLLQNPEQMDFSVVSLIFDEKV
jgi:hypothetical protein